MFIDQIIELELWKPGTPGRAGTPVTGYFHMTKQKSLRKIFKWIISYS